ncbi:hypothetical protein [Pseudomonas tolaasii]|uniref:hypothetical protein n=1 Tax=Pseudomonas tolaasii TaxID=29442 RepID=UPI0012FD45AC|nr:hypothetical protein [Pseudomonas tolaasii]MBW1249836.1 hypothetical protein [Pseudomonas tolaasii]NVZ48058.1 hypothetical protein [Pseudomonas tolaasii]NWA50028.1 hypothetical protein [Pseudomonas tolaasii]NWC25035.1 hypothetical protein [Pseudomonas tolaasii]NWC54038.1 hypothetical protein [Pseudomonas tolaasii]
MLLVSRILIIRLLGGILQSACQLFYKINLNKISALRINTTYLAQHPARWPYPGRAKCTMVSGRIEGSKAEIALPKWQEGMKTPLAGAFVGLGADSCAKKPFINQNKPCNLPDYSGTNQHHS